MAPTLRVTWAEYALTEHMGFFQISFQRLKVEFMFL